MKSGRDEAARGSIPGSSPRPDREHGKPQPTTCYTVVCVKTAVEISEESRSKTSFSMPKTEEGGSALVACGAREACPKKGSRTWPRKKSHRRKTSKIGWRVEERPPNQRPP